MHTKKIIFLTTLPTTKIFAKKIDPWWFSNNGFNVEFWDLSKLFWSSDQLDAYFKGSKDLKFIGPEHKSFMSKSEFKKSLSSLPKGTIIWNLNWEMTRIRFNEFWILFALKKNKVQLIMKQYDLRKSREIVGTLKRLFNFIMAKLIFLIHPPSIFFGCGSYARKFSKYVFPNTRFISVPSPRVFWDFQDNIEKDCIVFVDESIEYAPDARMFNKEICRDLKGYYNRLNNLFDFIEKHLNLDVLVAASGKYIYPSNPFNDRKIIYKKTLNLISTAHYILGHSSSALEQGIICNIPIIVLNDKSFTSLKKNDVEEMASTIFLQPVYSDNLEEISKNLSKNMVHDNTQVDLYYKEYGLEGDSNEIIKDSIQALY